jgi:hypothetical protein
LRAWSPPYQPTLKASAFQLRVVVETYSRNSSPGRTLTRSAKPSISSAAPRLLIFQSLLPGSEFSAVTWTEGVGEAETAGCSATF